MCGASRSLNSGCKTCEDCRGYVRGQYRAHKMARAARKDSHKLCRFCTEPACSKETKDCAKHWIAKKLGKLGLPRSMYHALWTKFEEQRRLCHYTATPLIPGPHCSLDHVVPRNKGGSSALDNLVWCRTDINVMKRDHSSHAFIAMCREVAAANPS